MSARIINSTACPGVILIHVAAAIGWLAGGGVALGQNGGSADLWQARNGTPQSPSSPVEWVRGNAGPANSHYVEGYSVPYRLVLTGLSPGRHLAILEWDTRQSGKNAIDYLTHYQRLTPHNQFGAHLTPELIQPLDGLSGDFSVGHVFPIPEPSTAGSSVARQPALSFDSLPDTERLLTIWNGRITNAAYVRQDSLAGEAASSSITIEFVAEEATVVIAWGGHVASKLDWGAGQSAAAIGGSPYHMRMLSLDGGGGNQDRSLQALAVGAPPTNAFSGPGSVCPGTTNSYAVATDAGAGAVFSWAISNNTANAHFVDPATNSSVQIVAAGDGSFTLFSLVTFGQLLGASAQDILVLAPVVAAPMPAVNACVGETVSFLASATGAGPLTFQWRKDGAPIPGATGPTLTLPGVGPEDAGSYCVEIAGACNAAVSCAPLTLEPLPALLPPADLVVECFGDLPAPDPGLVIVVAGRPPVTVVHAGDVITTNAGDFIISRTYQAIDACGHLSSALQQLIARDRTPPSLTCPSPMHVAENPAASGQAPVTYPLPSASDSCGTPAVVCFPPPGASFPVGDTQVNCLAADPAGNTNGCTFLVRVVPLTITVTSLADAGPGTLRQALLDANATTGTNAIHFDFPGLPPHTIALLSPLPAISDGLFIDGWSQITFAGAPVVQLDGTQAAPPISPAAVEADVAGLVLSAGGTTVRGLALNHFTVGLRIEGPGGNVVAGNYIGTDFTGTNAVGNRRDGILLTGGASNNIIGPGNVIAFNGRNGITLDASAGTGNAIFGNQIVFNGALGIDLGDDGTTANDPEDPDSGPNNLENSPVLSDVRSDGFASTFVRGTLNGRALETFSIEFFLEQPADPDPRHTQVSLGSVTVSTDAEGNGTFDAVFAVPARVGQFITAVATDSNHNSSEFALRAAVRTPPIILVQPVGIRVPPGTPATLCVTATGSEPLLYQWRRNGANIPGATNECFDIPSPDLPDGGSYTVVVANDLGAVGSDAALLRLVLPQLAAGDNFADRVVLEGASGLVSGTNLFATKEPGEPNHAGKPGGRSLWYTWTAPADGIASFLTIGSTFDTLLGIYLGTAVSNLTTVARDEDRGGFYTSAARFNATAGVAYQIAIDGFGGAEGDFVLNWALEVTKDSLPIITNQPVALTVAAGATAQFQVGAFGNCREVDHDCRHQDPDHPDHPDPHLTLTYQWYLNGAPLPGATASILTLTNVGDADVGTYVVLVNNGARFVFSDPAGLQINEPGLAGQPVQNVQAADKFLDAANETTPLRLGTPTGSGGGGAFTPAALARGYTGTQIFSTVGSLTEGEILCGVTGGASEWIPFLAEETGLLYLNTDGSSFDTVLAVFRRSPTNATKLELIACDNNSGLDGRDSALQVPVQAGQTNYIVIDGVNGATGTLRLNYALVTPAALNALGLSAQRAGHVRVSGHAAMRFTVQASTNLVTWVPLFTTNSPNGLFDFLDASTNIPRRFYRALMLP